jgi:hypothetical protein
MNGGKERDSKNPEFYYKLHIQLVMSMF